MSTELEDRLTAQYAVSRALAESDTVADAAEGTLAAIGRHLGWSMGIFWLLDAGENVLYPSHIWSAAPNAELERETRTHRLACGEGLSGHVWQIREPVWEPDVGAEESSPRAALAQHGGLHAALAFPVSTREEFLGVIELLTERTDPPPDQLLATVGGIGQQIGQFIARRRASEAELAAVRLCAAVVAAATDCIVTIDQEGRVLEFNPAAERTFGYWRDQVLGKPIVDFLVPPGLRASFRRGMARYLETGESEVLGRRLELSASRANGDTFPVEVTVMRVDQPGPPVFTAYLRDLTDTKRLESVHDLLLGVSDILSASLDYEETLKNLSRVIVPAFADWYAVDIIEPSGRLRRLEVSHRDPAKVDLARRLAERYPEERNAERGVYHVIATGQSELMKRIPDSLLTDAARDDEHLRLIRELGLRSAMIVPLRTDHGVVGAMTLVTAESGRVYDERDLAVAEDVARRAGSAVEKATLFAEVSESRLLLEQQAIELEAQSEELEETASELEITVEDLRHTNEALRSESQQAELARQQADEANKAKSEFLASMSHELRTPLNAIIGYAQLLEIGVHGPLEARQVEDLHRIDRSAQHLLGLITDILNFAKIEAGRLEFQLGRVRLGSVLARVEELIAPQAAAKNLSYEIARPADLWVRADEEKLLQIFVNLVSNAIRYTNEGGRIRVECRVTNDRIWTDVHDTGVGIPPAKLSAIFEPFVQVDRSYAGERQGTGLGLAISRELARGMGGDLTVESDVGKGSTFSVVLSRER